MPRDVPEPVASKFVVRKLPPELTEDAFKAVLQGVCQDELEWFRYHPGSTGYALILAFWRKACRACSLSDPAWKNARLKMLRFPRV